MSSINIIAKTSLESLPNYIESDKMYNIYFITSINNNNKKGTQTFKINNTITYIKHSRIIKKSITFLNENDALIIPQIEYDIRYLLVEEV